MAKITGIDPTVSNFLLVLDHELTRYDMKQKDNNIYRLGHLFEAGQKVRDDMVNAGIIFESHMTNSIADCMLMSLNKRFEVGFPPIKKVTKQITQFLATGKRPSLK